MPLSVSLKEIYARALRYAAGHNLPWLAAMVILPAFKTLKPAKSADARTVVILPKEGFTEDVMTALADADAVKVVSLPRIIVKLLASPFLPYFIDDNNYASCGAEYDAPKLRYRKFLVARVRNHPAREAYRGHDLRQFLLCERARSCFRHGAIGCAFHRTA